MLTVRSTRGGSVQVGSFLPWTVSEAARAAALQLGYAAHGVYTLADANGNVLHYDDPAPEHGVYELVDAGVGV